MDISLNKQEAIGFARLQTQSRVSINTWRRWCEQLKLEPKYAIAVWDEICYPIVVATQRIPEIIFILRLRSIRTIPGIEDFKQEIARLLHTVAFLFTLQSERLSLRQLKTGITDLYKQEHHAFAQRSIENPLYDMCFIYLFIVRLCVLLLVAKVSKHKAITMSILLQHIGEGDKKISFDHVVELALESLQHVPYASLVQDCLHEYQELSQVEHLGLIQQNASKFLTRFKACLCAICRAEVRTDSSDDSSRKLLERRLQIVENFVPFSVIAPSLADAREIAQQRGIERARASRPTMQIRAKALRSAFSVNRHQTILDDFAECLEKKEPDEDEVMLSELAVPEEEAKEKWQQIVTDELASHAKQQKQRLLQISQDVVASQIATQSLSEPIEEPEVIVSPEDRFELIKIWNSEFSEVIHTIGGLLFSVSAFSEQVWELIIEPQRGISGRRTFAEDLATEGSLVNQAYMALRQVAQYSLITELFDIPSTFRGFFKISQLNAFISKLAVYETKELRPDNRQLFPLCDIVCSIGATLVRLEAIKLGSKLIHNENTVYPLKTIAIYYRKALKKVLVSLNREIADAVCECADNDIEYLFTTHRINTLWRHTFNACSDYVINLRENKATVSLERLKEFFVSVPLQFSVDQEEKLIIDTSQQASNYVQYGRFGPIFDHVVDYVLMQAWSLLCTLPELEEHTQAIITMIRRTLVRDLTFASSSRRHVEAPSFAIDVICLADICEDPHFRDFYVQATSEGQIKVVEGYEDGQYVDVFELREYTPSRIHTVHSKEETVLHTGRQYLYTVGRTKCLTFTTLSDLMDSYVKTEQGRAQIFPIFNV